MDIEDIIAAHAVVMSVEPAEANPSMPQGSDDMDHWRCVISAEAIEGFEVFVSFGKGYEGVAPDLPTVLGLVLEDVRSYRGCEGYADFAAMLGLEEGESEPTVEAAWNELGRLSAAVVAFEAEVPTSAPTAA